MGSQDIFMLEMFKDEKESNLRIGDMDFFIARSFFVRVENTMALESNVTPSDRNEGHVHGKANSLSDFISCVDFLPYPLGKKLLKKENSLFNLDKVKPDGVNSKPTKPKLQMILSSSNFNLSANKKEMNELPFIGNIPNIGKFSTRPNTPKKSRGMSIISSPPMEIKGKKHQATRSYIPNRTNISNLIVSQSASEGLKPYETIPLLSKKAEKILGGHAREMQEKYNPIK